MKNLTWQNPEQLFVAQELINKVKSKCCGIKGNRYAAVIIYILIRVKNPVALSCYEEVLKGAFRQCIYCSILLLNPNEYYKFRNSWAQLQISVAYFCSIGLYFLV